jgi:hypothetical protein
MNYAVVQSRSEVFAFCGSFCGHNFSVAETLARVWTLSVLSISPMVKKARQNEIGASSPSTMNDLAAAFYSHFLLIRSIVKYRS